MMNADVCFGFVGGMITANVIFLIVYWFSRNRKEW